MTTNTAESKTQAPSIFVIDPPGLMRTQPRNRLPCSRNLPQDLLNPFLRELPSNALHPVRRAPLPHLA